jgi:sulfotransferase famil protein
MTYPYAVKTILDRYSDLKPEEITQRLRYSTFVSIPKRYLYFEVPKAACTKMKTLLRSLEQAPPLKLFAAGLRETRRDMFVHARENVPLPSLLDLHDKTQKEVLESPDFLRFTFVRNPYTRLASSWKNKILLCEPDQQSLYLQIRGHLPELRGKSLIGFEEFVDYIANHCDLRTCDSHWRRQVDHLFFSALNFSYVGKIEQMADGLARFEQHLRLSAPLTNEARNVSHSSAVVYNQNLAEKVYSLYQADFETLGYDRQSWRELEGNRGDTAKKAAVREETFADEVIERNIIILHLYQERDRARDEMRQVFRLQLRVIANAVRAVRNLSSGAWSNLKRSTRQEGRGNAQ